MNFVACVTCQKRFHDLRNNKKMNILKALGNGVGLFFLQRETLLKDFSKHPETRSALRQAFFPRSPLMVSVIPTCSHCLSNFFEETRRSKYLK